MQKIGLVTCSKLSQLTNDDQLLLEPLHQAGVSAEPVVWDDVHVEWRDFSCVVIRSCWDYHTRLEEFLNWIASLENRHIRVLNIPEIIRWNCHKRYLLDLETKGIPIVHTVFLARNSTENLQQFLKAQGWQRAVIKPTVSATAYETWLTSCGTPESDEIRLKKMFLEFPEVMVQPFLDVIQIAGEWSFIFFDGCFSHAVLKKPKEGDFRVQEDFGGHALQKVPSDTLIKQAEFVLHALDETPLYARVDGVEVDGKLILMELELIEPALFFGLHKEVPDRFAQALVERLRA